MQAAHRRNDISDKVWELLEPHLLGAREHEALLPEIIEIFSMQFFGSSEQVCPGEICHLTMGTGKILIAVFAGGEIGAYGKDYSKFLYPNQILHGLRLTQVISRFTRTPLEHMVVIRIGDAQKGDQLQDTFGRGCAWYAGQNVYYSRPRCRLFAGLQAYRRNRC